jgi:hypothetical protein
MLPTGSVTNAMLGGSITDSKLNQLTSAGKVANSATTAASANTANAIVARDGSGNFIAGTITATLSGNATTASTWLAGRNLSLTDDVTATLSSVNGSANVSAVATIANNAVSNAKLRDSAGVSVIGRSSSTTGDPADIVASSDGHVLRRSSGSLAFGSLGSNSLDADAVTTVKIQNGAVTNDKIANLTILNGKVASNAAIEGTKINPNFGTQNVVASGTVSAHKFIPTTGGTQSGDGMYLNGANTLAFSTNGIEKVQITSGGNVGIGLGGGAPTQRLHILGGDIRVDRQANTDGAISFGGTTEYIYGNSSTDGISIGTNGANRVIVGNLGTQILGTLDCTGNIGTLGSVSAGSATLAGALTVTGTVNAGTVRSANLPHFGCRAWVNFNGQGVIGTDQPIRGSGNVTRVFKVAFGHYRIDFTEPMPNANYCMVATTNASAGAVGLVTEEDTDAVPSGRSVNSVEVRTFNNGGGVADRFYINVAIFV